jgi:hypothetical protein
LPFLHGYVAGLFAISRRFGLIPITGCPDPGWIAQRVLRTLSCIWVWLGGESAGIRSQVSGIPESGAAQGVLARRGDLGERWKWLSAAVGAPVAADRHCNSTSCRSFKSRPWLARYGVSFLVVRVRRCSGSGRGSRQPTLRQAWLSEIIFPLAALRPCSRSGFRLREAAPIGHAAARSQPGIPQTTIG